MVKTANKFTKIFQEKAKQWMASNFKLPLPVR